MNKIFNTTVATALVLALFTSLVLAASPTQTLDVKLSSAKKGAVVKKFRATFVTGMDDGSRLSAAIGSVVSLPQGYKINSDKFASKDKVCKKSQIEKNYLKCPKGSLLGTGSVTVDASPIFSDPITGKLYAYSGGKKKIYLMPLITQGGLSISGIPIEGTIKKSSGDYGVLLDFDMPAFPTVPGGDDAAITKIDMTFNAVTKVGKKKYGYLTNPKKCTGGAWKFRTDSSFKDGSSTYSEDTVSCS